MTVDRQVDPSPLSRRVAVGLAMMLVACLAASGLGPANALAAIEILSDGFESGTLSSWTVGTGGDATAAVRLPIVKTGTKAARLAESNQPGSYA